MPIYEYRCSSCGHQQEFMQKLSDPTLTVCTKCNQPTFAKMVTAAGFQLKGSGWYVTDFKNKGSSGGKAAAGKPAEGSGGDKPAASTDSSASSGDKGAEKSSSDKKADSPAPSKPAATP